MENIFLPIIVGQNDHLEQPTTKFAESEIYEAKHVWTSNFLVNISIFKQFLNNLKAPNLAKFSPLLVSKLDLPAIKLVCVELTRQ